MNLDKHDIFRNAAPGFVFLIAALSFYVVTSSDIPKNQQTLVGLVAGFPLGFIIHNLYRIIFHIGSGEQVRMDEQEASWVSDTVFKGSSREKAHYLMFQLCKTHKDQNWKEWKARIDFLYSYIHALGASVFAIVAATILALSFIFIFEKNHPLPDPNVPFHTFLVAGIWTVIATIFYFGRKHVKKSMEISIETFCKEGLKLNKVEGRIMNEKMDLWKDFVEKANSFANWFTSIIISNFVFLIKTGEMQGLGWSGKISLLLSALSLVAIFFFKAIGAYAAQKRHAFGEEGKAKEEIRVKLFYFAIGSGMIAISFSAYFLWIHLIQA